MKRTIKFIAIAYRWSDKQNGNTYYSVRITRCRDDKVIASPMEYGYGDYYKQIALEAMTKAKWLPMKYLNGNEWNYERENGYPIEWVVIDSTKRDCIANGTL